jgi:hypothetical protein
MRYALHVSACCYRSSRCVSCMCPQALCAYCYISSRYAVCTCPHTALCMYVSAYCSMCVRILLYVRHQGGRVQRPKSIAELLLYAKLMLALAKLAKSHTGICAATGWASVSIWPSPSRTLICVSIMLYMCPHTAMCPHTQFGERHYMATAVSTLAGKFVFTSTKVQILTQKALQECGRAAVYGDRRVLKSHPTLVADINTPIYTALTTDIPAGWASVCIWPSPRRTQIWQENSLACSSRPL